MSYTGIYPDTHPIGNLRFECEESERKGVKDAAVVGIPNEKYGEVAAAVVVLEKGAQLTEEQIKEEMLKEMARFKVPERILFLDAIPKTPGLKTDKKYIRTLFQ